MVIPTRNRAEILKETLGKLVKEKWLYEIIIVDGASEDKTREVVESFVKTCKDIKIEYHRSNKREGSPKASNVGMNLADGDFLIRFDDDMFIKDKKSFDVVIKDFENNPTVGIVGGRRIEVLKPSSDSPFYMKYGDIFTKFTGYIFLDIFSDTRIADFVCAPFFIRKEIAKKTRYDEMYKGSAFREESDFQQEVKQKGWTCLFEPKFEVYHFGQDEGGNRGQTIGKRLYWKTRNHIYFLFKNFGENKMILFWYVLCGLCILTLYSPQSIRHIINGFKDGTRLSINAQQNARISFINN